MPWSFLVWVSRVPDFQDKTHQCPGGREGVRTTSAFLQGLMVFSRHYMAIISNFHFHVVILVLACTDISYSGYYVWTMFRVMDSLTENITNADVAIGVAS